MPTKVKKISSKIFAVLCAITVLLGVFVLSTSAQEPTERATADNPFGYGYVPVTNPYLRRIPVSLSTSKGSFSCNVPSNEFIGDEQDNYLHNVAWLTVTYEGQNTDGDLTTYTLHTPFADCYYLAYGQYYEVYDSTSYYAYVDKYNSNITFSISYEGISYPDSIVEAYVYIGVNPLRYGYDSNTSGGNTEEAYQNGYTDGYDTGYTEGYNNGYDTASSQIENNNNIKDLGEGFFNGLVETFLIVYQIPVFGTTLGEIIGYILTALIVLFLVKVVSFVV